MRPTPAIAAARLRSDKGVRMLGTLTASSRASQPVTGVIPSQSLPGRTSWRSRARLVCCLSFSLFLSPAFSPSRTHVIRPHIAHRFSISPAVPSFIENPYLRFFLRETVESKIGCAPLNSPIRHIWMKVRKTYIFFIFFWEIHMYYFLILLVYQNYIDLRIKWYVISYFFVADQNVHSRLLTSEVRFINILSRPRASVVCVLSTYEINAHFDS